MQLLFFLWYNLFNKPNMQQKCGKDMWLYYIRFKQNLFSSIFFRFLLMLKKIIYFWYICLRGYYQNIKIASFLFFVKICIANIRVQKQPPRCSIYKAFLRKSYNVFRNAYKNLDYFLLLT